MVLMRSRTLASPSATIFSGVSAAANSAGVALLTPASVACAESTTATSKVNGLTYCSSPLGSGLAAAKRRNASSTSAAVQALPGFAGFDLGGGLTVFLAFGFDVVLARAAGFAVLVALAVLLGVVLRVMMH